jgi:hypothetical protein
VKQSLRVSLYERTVVLIIQGWSSKEEYQMQDRKNTNTDDSEK